MSDEQDNFTVGGFREYQDDNLERNPDEVLPHSGFVRDEQIDRQMTVRALHHDPDRWEGKAAATYMDVQKNRDILRGEGSHTARDALENGDTLTLKHYIGDPSQQADLSGIKAITRLQEIVAGPAPVIVVLGEMGAGKTNLACLLLQLRDRWVDGDLLVGSNIRTLPKRRLGPRRRHRRRRLDSELPAARGMGRPRRRPGREPPTAESVRR